MDLNMTFLNKTFLTVATAALLATTSAQADNGKTYVGAKFGIFNVDVDANNINVGKPTAYGVYAGYLLDNNFGIEGEYITSSDAEITFNDIPGASVDFNARTIGLYATYDYRFVENAPNLYVKGKLGLAESKNEIGKDGEVDGNGLAGGIALGYDLTEKVTVQAEYEKLPDSADDASVDLINVGLHYRY